MNQDTGVRKYTQLDAQKYVGKRVQTTDRLVGYVREAHPSGDGTRILIHVWGGSWSYVTDNEHATIVR